MIKPVFTTRNTTWDDVILNLEYPFAKKAISACLKHREGDPKRRRFVGIRTFFDEFRWININFRKKYINVYCKVSKEYGSDRIRQLFGENLEISEWRDGISFLIDTEKEFEKLAEWLNL